MRSYYEVLELEDGASLSEVKKAYRRLAKIYHPDTTELPKDVAEKKMAELSDAYQHILNGESSPPQGNSYESGGYNTYGASGQDYNYTGGYSTGQGGTYYWETTYGGDFTEDESQQGNSNRNIGTYFGCGCAIVVFICIWVFFTFLKPILIFAVLYWLFRTIFS